MADRVYPSGKPSAAGDTNPTAAAAFPATKAQLYNASRPAYRPLPPPRRRSRCCSCCLWTTLILVVLILLAAIAAAALWLVYSPRRPSFSVSAFKVSQFNLSSTSRLSSAFSLSVVAKNTNKKISFEYSPASVSVRQDSDGDRTLGDGSFPGFVHPTKNTTLLKTDIVYNSQVDDAGSLRADLKKNKGLKLKVEMNTKVRVRVGKMKTKRVRVRVTCGGITAKVPTGKTATMATTGKAKCKVDLRFKIWKWTF